jgi:hypothetical protein
VSAALTVEEAEDEAGEDETDKNKDEDKNEDDCVFLSSRVMELDINDCAL